MPDDKQSSTYIACGFRIRSTIELTGSVSDERLTTDDVSVSTGDLSGYTARIGNHADNFLATAEEVCFTAQGVGTILLQEGKRIIIDFASEAERHTALRLSVLEPLLAIIAYQRGELVLHGSAVGIGDKAVVFIGNSGWGKSTTAAALFKRGHRLIGDDIAVMNGTDHGMMIYPSFPQIKLTTDAARILGYNPAAMPEVFQQPDKRSLDAGETFSPKPATVARIYVLSGQHDGIARIEPLSAQQALAELIRHSYRIEWLHTLSAPQHLRQCSTAVATGIVRRFVSHRQLPDIYALAQMVEDDVQNNP